MVSDCSFHLSPGRSMSYHSNTQRITKASSTTIQIMHFPCGDSMQLAMIFLMTLQDWISTIWGSIIRWRLFKPVQGESKEKVSESVLLTCEGTGILTRKPYSSSAHLPTGRFEHGQ